MAISLLASLWIINSSLAIKSPKTPLLREYDSNTQLLIQGNSLKGKSAIIRGTELIIWEASEKYGVDYGILYNLAKCESGLVHENKWGDNGRSFGIYQWQQASWKLYNNKFGLSLERNKIEDQAELTAIVLKNGGWRNWFNCFNKYKVLGDFK